MATAGETVARPVNLAQASQSRLDETNRGSPRPVYANGHPGDPLLFFERASISPKREGSLLVPFSSHRLGEGNSPERECLTWARPFSL